MELVPPKHHTIRVGHINFCQFCGSEKLAQILDMGHQALPNTVLTKDERNKEAIIYPLRLVWCKDCCSAQTDYCVDKNIVYHQGYPYKTGATTELVEYFAKFSEEIISKYNLNPKSLVVDIGSNDGTFLSHFKRMGVSVIGVEPTNTAIIANGNDVKTLQTFFDDDVAQEIISSYGQVDVVLASNVFERIDNIGDVITGIELLLKDDGVFILEFHSLLAIVTGGQFDAIYHEHLKIFSLHSLIKLFGYYNMTIIAAEHGFGSRHNLKIYVAKGKDKKVEQSIANFLKIEKESGLLELETYLKFAERAKKTKRDFVIGVTHMISEGKRVVANSCPARLVIPLNYFGADTDLIPYVAENPVSPKIGMYVPGSLIPIVANTILLKEQPDYILILAYNYADIIVKQLKSKGITSDFIIPLPDFRIIKSKDVIL